MKKKYYICKSWIDLFWLFWFQQFIMEKVIPNISWEDIE